MKGVRVVLFSILSLSQVSLPGCGGPDSNAGPVDDTMRTAVPVRAEEVRRVGSLSREEGSFGRLTGLGLHPAGWVVAFDQMTKELLIMDSLGTVATRIDGDHDGPGNLRGSACCISFDSNGHIWMRAGESFAGFDLGGRLVGEIPATFRRTFRGFDLMFESDGGYLFLNAGEPDRMMRRGPRGDTVSYGLSAFDALHEGVEELLTVATDVGERVFSPAPFGVRRLTAARHDGYLARATTASYSVQVFDSRGEPEWTASRPREGPPLSRRQLDSAKAALAPQIAQAEVRGWEVSPFEWPTHNQVLRDLWFDEEGRLWVQLTGDDDGHSIADVYDQAGEYLFTAEWPADVTLAFGAIRGEDAWGLSKGPFDIDVIVALRFRGVSR